MACEVDIYGALSEYIGACVTGDAVTLLDINNSVPRSLFDEDIAGKVPLCAPGHLHGLPLRQHACLQDVRQPGGEVPADSEPAPGGRRYPRLHPGHAGGGTLRLLPSPSTGCSVIPTATSGPPSPRARCCPWPPVPSAALVFLPSMTWAGSTVMCFWPSGIPHHGAVAFAHCGKDHLRGIPLLGRGGYRLQPACRSPISRGEPLLPLMPTGACRKTRILRQAPVLPMGCICITRADMI